MARQETGRFDLFRARDSTDRDCTINSFALSILSEFVWILLLLEATAAFNFVLFYFIFSFVFFFILFTILYILASVCSAVIWIWYAYMCECWNVYFSIHCASLCLSNHTWPPNYHLSVIMISLLVDEKI